MEIDFKFSLFYKYFCDNTEKKKKKHTKINRALGAAQDFVRSKYPRKLKRAL